MQVGSDARPHGVKDEIDPFTAGEFRGRNKVTVACHEHDLVDLSLVGHRCNIEANTHIDTLLTNVVLHVFFSDLVNADLVRQELLKTP
jgi:hypothetical protein